ncbi:aminodeoxychorismate lyase [Bacillus sp. ISL-40]|uniref:endolytic transglycosylase MltG n=1 Tax=unclassified Bacillus (in: firmicutes) TaxID=185979 RepID=UPI001BE85ED0|nr:MULTISPECIES: endolytic transglycosylase MltG [unclassified Bacillus (in: firmicutes)]MBT2696436.1 aminodeoxychorismate lyase [Bacillus sp. ISL-40]MBT2741548.1 aminodeoxychorismate lyase [Bacillus sp. ISL-77]
MKFNVVSSFAAGILLASTICGAVYFTEDPAVTKAAPKPTKSEQKTVVQPTEAEMKDTLLTAGYIVQPKADYDKTIEATKKAASAASANNNSKKIVYRAVISVTQGMTSIDVGRMLEKAKIVPDDFKFSRDVEKKGVEKNLRPGTFTVDTEMSYDQVIATIFKK